MIPRQNHGTYTTSRPRTIARTMERATAAGGAASPEPGMPALIRVSTIPAFTVSTRTPAEA